MQKVGGKEEATTTAKAVAGLRGGSKKKEVGREGEEVIVSSM